MRKYLAIAAMIILGVMLIGCTRTETDDKTDDSEGEGGKTVHKEELTVGTDITMDDITDFYYTEENINYDAYYQRYRFYTEDGKHMFFHETRRRKDDYGPCTEADTTDIGTAELTDDQWAQFYHLVEGGIVKAREESADSGGTGPWLYLYWVNDKSEYQQYSFESYGKEKEFVEFCLSMAPQSEADMNGKITDEQALAAIEKYCRENNPDLEDIEREGEYPVYWEVESSTDEEVVILYRSYTGALVRYHIDPVSGETHVTEFVQGITDEEEPTGETFDVREYIEQE